MEKALQRYFSTIVSYLCVLPDQQWGRVIFVVVVFFILRKRSPLFFTFRLRPVDNRRRRRNCISIHRPARVARLLRICFTLPGSKYATFFSTFEEGIRSNSRLSAAFRIGKFVDRGALEIKFLLKWTQHFEMKFW